MDSKYRGKADYEMYFDDAITLDTVFFDGYITDKNGNNLVFIRENSIHKFSMGGYSYFVYDTADGSMKCDMDIEEVFNMLADTKRFPNAVEPFVYNS